MMSLIYNVVYISKACNDIYSYHLGSTKCNFETENPVVWFYNSESTVRYAVGIKLKDLVYMLLKDESNPIQIGNISTTQLFRIFIRHLQWDLKRKNIRQWVDFCASKKLNNYEMENHPDEVYSAINNIFIKYIKLIAKWKQNKTRI